MRRCKIGATTDDGKLTVGRSYPVRGRPGREVGSHLGSGSIPPTPAKSRQRSPTWTMTAACSLWSRIGWRIPRRSSPCSLAPTASTTPPTPASVRALSPEILVIRNLTTDLLNQSAQALEDGHQPGADDCPPRRLLRRRRAGRLRQVHRLLLPQPQHQGRRPRAAQTAGRPDAGHLQRLPGAHQAGSGALWRDSGHGRQLPHPDLQPHRPPPEPLLSPPGWPPSSPPGC